MDVLEIAEALSRAIMDRDLESIRTLYADDVRVWHSYDRVEQDRAETLDFLRGFFAAASDVLYTDIRRVRTDEGYVQQHVIHVTFADGRRIEPRPACIVARVEGGKVTRIDEYIEPRRVAA
ncbi:hypothetical protein Sphch_3869 [Sphingobium chlorophenolicum L-1]|uniref:SnoaL-like domain-containing protein n=1 Tax=Sphingobium chlorophenolicum L-1 TaxID=690566 RepID=F6F1N5_SPHCR|nr:nuclear transport factor 2 family protein [Sphingobium chlorophenolicum]AEG51451.1 hypothetical protein Sphch_3869 [Sphingobium chlorophenolicum L-1]